MRIILLITCFFIGSSAFAQAPEALMDSILQRAKDLSYYTTEINWKTLEKKVHIKKNGSITKTNGITEKGRITYREFGERKFYFYPEGSEDSIFYERLNELESVTIEGRGTFHAILAHDRATNKMLALVDEENDAYIEYKRFTHEVMRIEPRDPNVMIQGSYAYWVKNKRTGVVVGSNNVNNIKKNIRTFIDYCDEIAEKVEKKEKGYKVTLIKRDYAILKDCIVEAAKTCPAE